ncbi:MAG TPA: DUF2490 domain-containing protein [Candidatus Omnitrophota bacterium]|nr:DUF2490 domain-containing protein [Candidatus Omnitrophota bacterium]HSA30554.1 DUF2490 domain-containing protein [Candidatus Omnitrophota bacterium]
MKKALFIVLLTALVPMGPAFAYEDGDVQFWNTNVEEIKISDAWKAAFEQEFRWGGDISEFYYQHYDLGLVYKLNKHWNLGFGFRYIRTKSNGDWSPENEPYLTAAVSGDLAGFKVEDRSRLEYQQFDDRQDKGRYRNKLTVKLPWKFTRFDIQPFFSDEVFIQFTKDDPFNQNRVSSGLGMKIAENFKAELYYMLQSSKGSAGWKDANVLGAKFKLSF